MRSIKQDGESREREDILEAHRRTICCRTSSIAAAETESTYTIISFIPQVPKQSKQPLATLSLFRPPGNIACNETQKLFEL